MGLSEPFLNWKMKAWEKVLRLWEIKERLMLEYNCTYIYVNAQVVVNQSVNGNSFEQF